MEQGTERITTVEMHTGGEPVRIITGGYPPIEGATLLEKRRFVRGRLDHLRRLLMAEPRGHADMYGALLVEPDLPEADLGVLFLHNEGYSTMCGHAVIALGRYAVDRGLVATAGPEAVVRLQCPCGLVTASVAVAGGRAGRVSFRSVPAFALARDAVVLTDTFGPVTLDLAYGGAFYGVLPAAALGLDLGRSPLGRIVEAAMQLKAAAAAQLAVAHPTEPDLGFLYGVIFTERVDRFRTMQPEISASSPMARSTAARPARASRRASRSCTARGRSPWARPGASGASPGPSSPAASSRPRRQARTGR